MAVSLKDKVVLITGASSGIGKACAKQFAEAGANLMITARRLDRLKALARELEQVHSVNVLPLELDVQNNQAVMSVISGLSDQWKNIDILVNNAGLALDTFKIQEGNPDHWDTMIKTNICGLLYVMRAVLPGMVERNQGHIVNIGSIAGHESYAAGNVYCATKHAVRAISKSTRIDLQGTAIRLSEIDPGAVHTEFSEVRWNDKKRSDEFYREFTALQADDIADAALYCTTRPAHVDVAEMIICPTAQASCNHIYRAGVAKGGLFE